VKKRLLTQSGLCLWAAVCLGFAAQAQTPDAGVVKVTSRSEAGRKTGTGFIVRLGEHQAYVVTASHVVEGDSQPQVEFFTQRNVPIAATVVGLEGGDPRGLALLLVSGQASLPSGLAVLPLASSLEVKGGDPITAVGFPQMAGPWAILRGSVVSRQGRDIIFDAAIDEGNSGGPLIKDNQVIGLVTGVSGRYGRATPAASVRLFVEGWGVQQQGATATTVSAIPKETPGAYPESEAGLQRLIEDILRSLQTRDSEAATRMVEGLVKFDHSGWFRRVFGEKLGDQLATSLRGVDTAAGVASLVETFADQVRNGRTVVQVERFTGQHTGATGYQNRAMAAMKNPEPVYSVRLLEPGKTLGYHLYNFIFTEGGFRLVGKMPLPPEFDKGKNPAEP
jgi:hypothetical protein